MQTFARIRRWSLTLAAYEYTIVFKKTEEHGNADALSRLPLQIVPAKTETPPEIVFFDGNYSRFACHCRSHSFLDEKRPLTVFSCSMSSTRMASSKRSKTGTLLLTENRALPAGWLILWGSRVIVPEAGRKAVLEELHSGHQLE